jgi:hypothetical protein
MILIRHTLRARQVIQPVRPVLGYLRLMITNQVCLCGLPERERRVLTLFSGSSSIPDNSMVETGTSEERRSVLVISMLRDCWEVSDDPGEEVVLEKEKKKRRNGDGGRSAETGLRTTYS